MSFLDVVESRRKIAQRPYLPRSQSVAPFAASWVVVGEI